MSRSTALLLAIFASLVLHGAAAALLVFAPATPLEPRRPPLSSAVEVGVRYGRAPGASGDPSRPVGAGASASRAPAGPPRVSRPAAPVRAARVIPAMEEPARPVVMPPEEPVLLARADLPNSPEVDAADGAGLPVAVREDAPGSDEGSGGAAIGSGGGAENGGGGGGLGEGGGGGGGRGGDGPGGGGGGVDLEAELAARLAHSAASCYPRAALRFRASGTARVEFCVGSEGRPERVRLLASSGFGLLDAAATGCVLDRAAPLPMAAACRSVPVVFEFRP